jgi:hypothetical protein
MAAQFEGIFSSIFGQTVRLRDTHHAVEAFGLNKSDLSNGTPRHKFEFFVRVNFDQNREVREFVRSFLTDADQSMVSTMVKSIIMPSMTMDTDILNQYNKKRISQKRLNFNPITITFHDSVEGRTLRLWEMYYEYYFKDGLAKQKTAGSDGRRLERTEFLNDIITDKFNDNFGYNLARVGDNKYLIESIDIYQVHGGRFSRTTIIRPRIRQFTHDTLDYEDVSGLVQMSMDFEYEDVIYSNVNQPLNADELDRYKYGDFWEMANLITIRTPVNGRDLGSPEPQLPTVNCDGTSSTNFAGADNFLSSPLGSTITRVIGQENVARVEDSISGIVGAIPDAIGTVVSASIFGGTVSLNPDPVQALRTTANQISRSVYNTARNNFQSTVSGAVTSVVSGITTTTPSEATPNASQDPPTRGTGGGGG